MWLDYFQYLLPEASADTMRLSGQSSRTAYDMLCPGAGKDADEVFDLLKPGVAVKSLKEVNEDRVKPN